MPQTRTKTRPRQRVEIRSTTQSPRWCPQRRRCMGEIPEAVSGAQPLKSSLFRMPQRQNWRTAACEDNAIGFERVSDGLHTCLLKRSLPGIAPTFKVVHVRLA